VSSYRYPFSRQPAKRYQSRRVYLEDQIHEPGRRPRLCQAIEAVVARGADPRRRNGEPTPSGDPWQGFPWLTLVIGSGCLELHGETGFSPRLIGESVRLQSQQLGIEGIRAHEVGRFAEALVEGRMGAPRERDGQPDDTRELDPFVVRLLALAALLTRLFHLLSSIRPQALARWDDDVVELREIEFNHDDFAEATYQGARRLIDDLVGDLDMQEGGRTYDDEGDAVAVAVRALLGDVADRLAPDGDRRPVEVRVDDVRLITEVAWYFLTQGSTIYPGWSDLLLSLMLREPTSSSPRPAGRPRPRKMALTSIAEAIQVLLQEVTAHSWRSYKPDDSERTERERLYEAAAEVLWEQANAARDRKLATALPPAVAFVTSFDIELDMALCAQAARRGDPGEGFAVALPVHLLREPDSADAEFCWLLGEVSPGTEGSWDNRLEALCKPGSWRLLTPTTNADLLRRQPTVVHLSGCPLYALPDLRSAESDALFADLAAVNVDVERGLARFEHAITVSEYLAQRQSEAELFGAAETNKSDAGGRTSRALPWELSHDTDRNKRFWMAIGVPIADDAIRLRVASQLTLRWFRPAATQPRRGGPLASRPTARDPERQDETRNGDIMPTAEGLAVNRRIAEDEADLLQWLGLAVVQDDFHNFVNDLFHYALHVRAGGVRAPMRGDCRLDEAGAR
jgi:hypothetical protein